MLYEKIPFSFHLNCTSLKQTMSNNFLFERILNQVHTHGKATKRFISRHKNDDNSFVKTLITTSETGPQSQN